MRPHLTSNRDANKAQVVKEFLSNPLARDTFDNFFSYSYLLVLTTIRYLKQLGFALPVDDRTDRDPLKDLAIDVLADFLESKPGRQFFVIFDYFRAHELLLPNRISDKELLARFAGLVRGFTRQKIWRIKNESDSQIANLKKSFGDIFKSRQYRIETDTANVQFISLASATIDENLPMVNMVELDRIVLEAYCQTTPRTDWCRKVFELLAQIESVQQKIRKSDLLAMVIAVNTKAVDLDQALSFGYGTPIDDLFVEQILVERDKTISSAAVKKLDKFVSGGRLSEDEKKCLLQAVTQYLTDLTESAQADKLTKYFRENMPDDAWNRYHKDYKYIFDSVVAKCLSEFRKRLRDNPIIKAFGYYLPDDGKEREV